MPFGRMFTREQVADSDHSDVPEGAMPISEPSNVGDSRRMLMDAISSFLLDHDLAISVDNLTAAHGAFSGLNPTLRLRIDARLAGGDPITQQWLDEVTDRLEERQDDEVVEKLVSELEGTLGEFSKNASDARNHTRQYNASLKQHISELEEGRDTGALLADMIGMTRNMLVRSRRAEAELRLRERETNALRRNLESAMREAEMDYLTGLPNRRAFNSLLDRNFQEAREACDPMAVAFCDIDHFKRINDTHGHDAGDRVIKAVADLLATISDDNCHVARHGGEEFVVLFRNVMLPHAESRLNDAREELAARRFRNRTTDLPFGQITFSAGIADASKYDSPGAALAAADAALYRAKESGRNQVIVDKSYLSE